ncbi:MAG: mechanosensitive ion channel family protein [Polyangiales bacterium]
MQETTDVVSQKTSQLVAFVSEYGPKVLGALIALVVAWLIAGWVRRTVGRALDNRKFDPTLSKFFSNASWYLILIAAVLSVLGIFGIQTTSFAAMLAAAGFAVGMAFQGTLGNFAAGIMLLVFRPFKIGDFVSVAGVDGVVEHIDLFTCEFRSLDNKKLVIPNGEVFGKTITNNTGYATRRVDIDVGADYSADIDKTRAALETTFTNIPNMINDPAPAVFRKGRGESSVDWQLRIWCKTEDYWAVYEQTIRAAKQAMDKAGIGIPFPQRDLHLDADVLRALSKN